MTRSTAHPDLAVVRHVTSRRGTIALALLVSVIAALPLLVRVDAVTAGSAGTVTGIAVWCAWQRLRSGRLIGDDATRAEAASAVPHTPLVRLLLGVLPV